MQAVARPGPAALCAERPSRGQCHERAPTSRRVAAFCRRELIQRLRHQGRDRRVAVGREALHFAEQRLGQRQCNVLCLGHKISVARVFVKTEAGASPEGSSLRHDILPQVVEEPRPEHDLVSRGERRLKGHSIVRVQRPPACRRDGCRSPAAPLRLAAPRTAASAARTCRPRCTAGVRAGSLTTAVSLSLAAVPVKTMGVPAFHPRLASPSTGRIITSRPVFGLISV